MVEFQIENVMMLALYSDFLVSLMIQGLPKHISISLSSLCVEL